MPKVTCYTSSSIGPCPTLSDNFDAHEETVSITWDDGFNFQDTSWLKVYHSVEVPDFLPGAVEKFLAHKDFYDVVLAWDERILQACPQAVFCTESACSWMDRKSHGSPKPFLHNFEGHGLTTISPVVAKYDSCDVSKKEHKVSFITSSKRAFPGHILRQEIYERLPERVGSLAVWKHRSPPYLDDKRVPFESSQFVICPENTKYNGYYSEKLVDCFIAKAIPLYWGCSNLASHFNMDGVITFENYDDLTSKLLSLTPESYHSRASAIEDNFQRALRGVHQWDQIEAAIVDGIHRKHHKEQTMVVPQIVSTPINVRRPPRPLRKV